MELEKYIEVKIIWLLPAHLSRSGNSHQSGQHSGAEGSRDVGEEGQLGLHFTSRLGLLVSWDRWESEGESECTEVDSGPSLQYALQILVRAEM